MPGFIRRHSLPFTSAALIILSLQLMSASIADQSLPQMGGRVIGATIEPISKLFHETRQTVAHVWDRYVWLIGVEEERDALRTRVKALEAENTRLIEIENENSRLRKLLEYSDENELRGLAASVIARDPSNWIKTVTIDRGSRHGVTPGMPVVDGHAIVGQTTAVSPESATVLLLTDSLSAIDAIVQTSRASGIVEGSFEDILKLRYVSADDSVEVGDRVVASGLDEIFPKGALIGVVTTVKSNDEGLFRDVQLQASADLERLETVMVLHIPKREKATKPGGAGNKE